MACAKITHQFDDGAATVMEVHTDANGPDSLDECVRRVLDLWRETCAGAGPDEAAS